MQREQFDEWIAYADAAYANRQYAAALEWLQKALEEDPNDLYVLSRAGAVCVTLNRFEDALTYFRHAVDVEPDNGENLFNLANAYFFKEEYGMAMRLYAQSLRTELSTELEGKIYFQMGMICSMRSDPENALINFRKYEATDPTGLNSLEPEFISEKLKMYALQEDYEMAAACAAQLVAVAPSVYPYYSIAFSLAMAAQNYSEAEKLLDDAGAYAKLSRNDKFRLGMQRVAFYETLADKIPEKKDEYLAKTQAVLSDIRTNYELTQADEREWVLSAAELSLKRGNHDQVIAILEKLLYPGADAEIIGDGEISADDGYEPLSDEEIDIIAQNEMIIMEQKIARGELDEDEILASGMITYDEWGNEIVEFGENVFGELSDDEILPEDPADTAAQDPADDESFADRARFMLLSCCAEKEYYEKTVRYAADLRNSKNAYYMYFSRYCEAFAQKKLSEIGMTAEDINADQIYAETLAFFRAKTMADSSDKYPIIFRARMYAETGKFVKAEEMLKLLSDEDSAAVAVYIDQCRAELSGQNE